MSRGAEENKNNAMAKKKPAAGSDKQKAIDELEAEKDSLYRELKSSLGEAEAKEQIKQFMVSLKTKIDFSLCLVWTLQDQNGRNRKHLCRNS